MLLVINSLGGDTHPDIMEKASSETSDVLAFGQPMPNLKINETTVGISVTTCKEITNHLLVHCMVRL